MSDALRVKLNSTCHHRLQIENFTTLRRPQLANCRDNCPLGHEPPVDCILPLAHHLIWTSRSFFMTAVALVRRIITSFLCLCSAGSTEL
ncbi:hypothetical protein PsYK624_115170 [Phanerochaete sordida]|uniref:Uncharacterized protein n=1 Tax=Phanerochaete sordida TaxID=48140 RepID=A0A9P3GI41_9APHY|nr:hypothetical protein PsYK624_115170 [Phanerochaete sordida]